MSPPLVHCKACKREWHSVTLADGLREMGSCPRCGGELVFAEAAREPAAPERVAEPGTATAPHLVLGVPRR